MEKHKEIQILDCTLRDGGYYTQWDFSDDVIEDYLNALADTSIDYIELGYRNPPREGQYYGQYYHLDVESIESIINRIPGKKIAIMLDAKSLNLDDLSRILGPLKGKVDLIRIAVNPNDIGNILSIANKIKTEGFELALNIMYLSKYPLSSNIFNLLKRCKHKVDFVYLVDSFGGALPEQVKLQVLELKKHYNGIIGFHGHNNLELAFANTLVAIEAGAQIIDSTVLGMGRGSGNLRTELILTYFTTKNIRQSNLNSVAELVNCFKPLRDKYNWGTNLPYMISGATNFPQGQIMNWIVSNRYSENDIVYKLTNKTSPNKIVHSKIEEIESKLSKSKVLILGGGGSARNNILKIKKYLKFNQNIDIYITSLKLIDSLLEYVEQIYFCFSGQQIKKLSTLDKNTVKKINFLIVPPSPRVIEVQLPNTFKSKVYELSSIHFEDSSEDSPLVVALELAFERKQEVELIGFDGYDNKTSKGRLLNSINSKLIHSYKNRGLQITMLGDSIYPNVPMASIHSRTML